jgi:prevent-host-death family protein
MVRMTFMTRRWPMEKKESVRVSVAEAKARFSELVNRASYSGERFLIERRGKPVGAIVSAEDLAQLESGATQPYNPGLIAAAGALAEFEDFHQIMEEIVEERHTRYDDRQVNLDEEDFG